MIDELQRVKDFGTSEPPPSEAGRNAARSALARAIADAERRLQPAPSPIVGRRPRWYVRGPRFLPIGAAVTVAAAAALFITTPWSNSPGFLARAEAALTPPTNMILHAKATDTTGCLANGSSIRWTAQVWIDERTQRYRGLFRDPFQPYPFKYFKLREIPQIGCMPGSAYETGGIVHEDGTWTGDGRSLRFVPPNRLVRLASPPGPQFGILPTVDPVAALRRAIRAGRAHDQGTTKLHGRTVERIRFDACLPKFPSICPADPLEDVVYAYVDPETYYPVEMRLSNDVIRFSKYEYLPRTTTNLALANIRAQHPHARLSD